MLFWDSSAIIAMLAEEESSKKIQSIVETLEVSISYISVITPLEIESTIQRKEKEEILAPERSDEIRKLATYFRKESHIIVVDQNVLDLSIHIQKIYKLRVADTIQLASARSGTESPQEVYFLSLDKKLNEAARLEGFEVPL